MRVTVYVPGALRARMKASEKKRGSNWSEIACRAFTDRVYSIDRLTGIDMSKAVERLRESKMEYAKQMTDRGREDGRDWAEKDAEYIELKRLYAERQQDFDISDYMTFARVITDDGDLDGVSDVFESLHNKQWKHIVDESEYIEGFVEGALDVYNELE